MASELIKHTTDATFEADVLKSTTPVLVLEIKATSLSGASDACQVQFNKSFMRILIERLTAANKKLTERAAEA